MTIEWSDAVGDAFTRHSYVAAVAPIKRTGKPPRPVIVHLHTGAARWPTADWEELVLKLARRARDLRLMEVRVTSPTYTPPPSADEATL